MENYLNSANEKNLAESENYSLLYLNLPLKTENKNNTQNNDKNKNESYKKLVNLICRGLKYLNPLFNPRIQTEFRNDENLFKNEKKILKNQSIDVFELPLQVPNKKINNEQMQKNNNLEKKSITRVLRKFIKNKDIITYKNKKFYFTKWQSSSVKKVERGRYKKIIKVRIEYSKEKYHSANIDRNMISAKFEKNEGNENKEKKQINLKLQNKEKNESEEKKLINLKTENKKKDQFIAIQEINLKVENSKKDENVKTKEKNNKKEMQKIQQINEKQKTNKIQEIIEKDQIQEKQKKIRGRKKENKKNEKLKFEIKENQKNNEEFEIKKNKEKEKEEKLKNQEKIVNVSNTKKQRIQKINENQKINEEQKLKNARKSKEMNKNNINGKIIENKQKIENKNVIENKKNIGNKREIHIKEKEILKNKRTLYKNESEEKFENAEKPKIIYKTKTTIKKKNYENPIESDKSKLKIIYFQNKNKSINYKKFIKNSNTNHSQKNLLKPKINIINYNTDSNIENEPKINFCNNIKIPESIKKNTRNKSNIFSNKPRYTDVHSANPTHSNNYNLNDEPVQNLLYHDNYRNYNNINNENIYMRPLYVMKNNSHTENLIQFSNKYSSPSKNYNIKSSNSINKNKVNYNLFVTNIPDNNFDSYNNKNIRFNYPSEENSKRNTFQNNISNINNHFIIIKKSLKEMNDYDYLKRVNYTENKNVKVKMAINYSSNNGNYSDNYEGNIYKDNFNTYNNLNNISNNKKNIRKSSTSSGKTTVIQHYNGMKKVINHYGENLGTYLNRISSGRRVVYKKNNNYTDLFD